MFCSKCGYLIESDKLYCSKCGDLSNNLKLDDVQPTDGKSNKKNKNPFIVILSIFVLAIVAIVGFIAIIMAFGYDRDSDNYVEVEFEDYSFSIPAEYNYTMDDNTLFVEDEKGNWTVELYILDGSYSKMVSNLDIIKSGLESSGYTTNNPIVKTLGNVEWITCEISYRDKNALAGYSKATESKLFGAVVYTTKNDFDESVLSKIGKILSKSKYIG